jgi:hypothetical protein
MRLSTQETAALRDFDPAYVGSGSRAALRSCGVDVCFAPLCGLDPDISLWPRSANNGRERVQQWMHQKADYSITSSARASSVGGISIPSAFATTRLMTRSNLVGCSTGRSPGFAPRKILST